MAARVNEQMCTECGRCVKTCPANANPAFSRIGAEEPPRAADAAGWDGTSARPRSEAA